MHLKNIFPYLLFSLFLSSIPVFSAENEVKEIAVEGVAAMGENLTRQQARDLAINDALRKATEELGIMITSNVTIYNDKVIQDMLSATSKGVIEEKKILREDVELVEKADKTKEIIYKVFLKAKVRELAAERRNFRITELSMDRKTYQEGDKITISLSADRDLYLHLFDIRDDEEVTKIFPLPQARSNLIKKGEPFIYPTERDGIRLLAQFPPKKSKSHLTDYVLAVVTSEDEVFLKTNEEKIYYLSDLLKELNAIDISKRAQRVEVYTVERKP